MIVLTNLDLYRYEINALVKAFYPADDVKVMLMGEEKVDRALRHGEWIFARLIYSKEEMVFTLEENPDQRYVICADDEEDFSE